MKTLIYIPAVLLLMIFYQGNTQIIESNDGVYYADNYTPYNGVYTEYYDNGKVRIEMELNEGIKDGKINIFFEDGSLKEIRSYKSGKMHGKWVTYNTNNVVIAEANYKKNRKHGKWLIYDSMGNLKYEMCYKNGKKDGIWKNYNPNGEIISQKEY